jgi:hypothetical protein
MGKSENHNCGNAERKRGPASDSTVTQSAKERIADRRRHENHRQDASGGAGGKAMSVLEVKRSETAHRAAGEIAQAETKRRANKNQPERRAWEQLFTGIDAVLRFVRRLFIGKEEERNRSQDTENSKFQDRRPPSRVTTTPAAVNRPEKESRARADSQQAECFARGFGISRAIKAVAAG